MTGWTVYSHLRGYSRVSPTPEGSTSGWDWSAANHSGWQACDAIAAGLERDNASLKRRLGLAEDSREETQRKYYDSLSNQAKQKEQLAKAQQAHSALVDHLKEELAQSDKAQADKMTELEGKLKAAEADAQESKDTHAKLWGHYLTWVDAYNRVDKELKESVEKNDALSSQLSAVRAQLAAATDQAAVIDKLKSERDAAVVHADAAAAEVTVLRQALKSEQSIVAEIRLQMDELTAKAKVVDDHIAELDNLRKEKEQLSSANSSLSSRVRTLEQQVAAGKTQTADNKMAELMEGSRNLIRKVAGLDPDFAKLITGPGGEGTDEFDHTDNLSKILDDIRILEGYLEQAKVTVDAQRATIHKLEGEVASLRAEKSDGSGSSEAAGLRLDLRVYREKLLGLEQRIKDLEWDNGVYRYRAEHPEDHADRQVSVDHPTTQSSKGTNWKNFPILEAQKSTFFSVVNHHLSVAIGGLWVLGQGLNWTRYNSLDGSKTTMIHNRHRDFWSVPRGLRLTPKGFVKLYRSKSSKWRVHMARAMGLSLNAADVEYFHAFEYDEMEPDMVPMTEDQVARAQRVALKKVVVVQQPGSSSASAVSFGSSDSLPGYGPTGSPAGKGKGIERPSSAPPPASEDKATSSSSKLMQSLAGAKRRFKPVVRLPPAPTAPEDRGDHSQDVKQVPARKSGSLPDIETHLMPAAGVSTGVSHLTPGYCYLRLFGEDSLQMAAELGAYPFVQDVDGLLTTGTMTTQTCSFELAGDLLHVTAGDETVSPWVLRRFPRQTKIGGENTDEGNPQTFEENFKREFLNPAKEFLTNPQWLRNGWNLVNQALAPTVEDVEDDAQAVVQSRCEPVVVADHLQGDNPTAHLSENGSGPQTNNVPVATEDKAQNLGNPRYERGTMPPCYVSPFGNLDYQPTRADQWVSGFQVTRLRHPAESRSIRSVTNGGIHGLPHDFCEAYPRMPGADFQRLGGIWKGAIGLIEQHVFPRDRGDLLLVTSNCDWVRDEPTINFVSGDYKGVHATPRADGGLNVHMPCKGLALRSVRLLVAFLSEIRPFQAMQILNGRLEDYTGYAWPKWNRNLPLPQVDSFYVEASCAGRTTLPIGFMRDEWRWLDYLINTATIYGAEEALLSRFPAHCRLSPPPAMAYRRMPFGSWGRNYAFTSERFWYDADWVLRDTRTFHDFSALCHITKLCRRDPPSEDLQAKLRATAEGYQKEWFFYGQSVAMALIIMSTLFMMFVLLLDTPVSRWICDNEVAYQCMSIAVLLFYGLALWLWSQTEQVFPDVLGPNARPPKLVHSSEEFSDDPGSTLLIPTMGTRGDHVPPQFFGNMATLAGVKTHMYNLQTATHQDLEQLKRGRLHNLVPGFVQNQYSRFLGYKGIFSPHIELDMPNATSYTLAPPRSYINRITYLSKEHHGMASTIERVVSWFAEELAESFWPDWRIGCLKGCNLPRSADGSSLIVKRKNLKTGTVGWLHGSADPACVPEDIRRKYELVPNGDHNEIFRHYDKIYMPGGAGAVQTAIACGCEVVVTDVNLDRDYHTMPTQEDFHQPSILPFFAWLWRQGFKVKIPLPLLWLGWVQYHWTVRWKLLETAAESIVRILLFWWFGCFNFLPLMALAVMLPRYLKKVFAGSVWCTKPGVFVARGLWRYPIFMFTPNWLMPWVAMMTLYVWWWPLTQDGLNYYTGRYELIYEPVSRGGFTFCYPFGHWCLRDTVTMEVYEGKFLTPGKLEIGDIFGLVANERPLKPNAVVHRVPFHTQHLLESLNEPPAPYSASHNCTTVILRAIMLRSLVGFIFAYGISWATYFVLKPPQEFARLYNWIFPERDWTQSLVFKAMGFAAGGTVPLEHEEYPSEFAQTRDGEEALISDPATDEPAKEPETEATTTREESWDAEQKLPPTDESLDWASSEKSIHEISNMINYLLGVFKDALSGLSDDEKATMAENIYLRLLEDVDGHIPEANDVEVLQLPDWKVGTFAELIDATHWALSQCLEPRLIKAFIDWIKGLGHNLGQIIWPVLDVLGRAMNAAYQVSKIAARRVFHVMCHWIDQAFGPSTPTRVKTVWGLTGILPNGLTGQKARLAQAITRMEYKGRGQFLDDYDNFVSNIKDKAKGLPYSTSIGGPQRRSVRYKKPVMSHQAAKILGFKPEEYVVDDDYQKRIDDYLREGIPQAVDGVLFGDKNPERIHRSIARYEPQYEATSAEDRALMDEVAEAMFNRWPEVFADRDIMPPNGVEAYIKIKYSPGSPFIGSKYTSRKMLKETGVMDVIKENALAAIRSGVYPTQFYHAFAKSQAVDGNALLPPKMKDLRTVVSQDIPSYFIDQVFQIEANKRITWETYGAGSGMPLNQAMDRIFDEFHDLKLKEGGQFIIADAKAYDSNCKRALFHASARLYDLGYQNHPSGKGPLFSQVIRCKYEAMQDAWIFGITEPSYDSLVFSVNDQESREALEQSYKNDICKWVDFLRHNDWSESDWKALTFSEQEELVKSMKIPAGKVLLTYHPDIAPTSASWQGSFSLGKDNGEYRKHQTYFYSSRLQLKEDIARVVHANRNVISNIHCKNRGGGTGQSATSWDNTATFKAGVIGAWARATGKRPHQFFDTNKFFNTSDDTVWWSKDLMTSGEVDKFKHAAAELGIMLEIGATRKITEVEYLSKLPRPPTAEDSEDYKAWRKGRLEQFRRANNLTPSQLQAFEERRMPRFMVVQNPTAIMLRRTAFRYYQGSQSRFLYTSCERGSGHALVTAFQPTLYKRFATEWCEDMNRLCASMHINQHWVLKDQECRQKMRVEQVNPQWKLNFKSSPRQEAFIEWQKQAKYPSYARVVHTHLNLKDPDPLAHEKFLAKLDRAWRGNDELLRDFVDTVYKATDYIPDEIKRFMPSVDMLYAENPWHTHNQRTEKFIYLRALENSTVDELTFSAYDSIVRESPYAICMNPIKFWEDLRNPEYAANVRGDGGVIPKVRIYQAHTIITSLIYFSMHSVEMIIQRTWLIGPLYNLFMWSFWGLSKVYGLANTCYWHSTARSSREISSIMPRDPYLWSKRFAMSMSDLVPEQVGIMCVLLTFLFDAIAEVVEILFGRIWRMLQNIKSVGPSYGDARAGAPTNAPQNPWLAHARSYGQQAIDHGRVTVAARTASGKSTFFPSAMWAERKELGVEKFWILMPTKLLVQEWSIPFDIRTQKVRRGQSLDPTADIFVTTYGHFLRRLPHIDVHKTIVFFDEFHLMSGFMLQGVEQWKGPTIFMSATPVVLHGMDSIPFLEPNMPRRHPLKVYKVDTDDVADMWLRAKNQFSDRPEILARPMVIVPTYKEVEKAIAGLQYLDSSVTWTEVSRKSPRIPATGGMVCTPYVQTGLDIKPPPTILIDSGRDIVIHRGRKVTPNPYTDVKTDEQRSNRVGRIMAGVVLQPQLAGSGTKPEVYPTGFFFSSDLVSRQYRVPKLTPIERAIHPEVPFLRIDYKAELGDTRRNHKEELSVKKSLLFMHLMALNGVERQDWQLRYTNYFEHRLPFSEDEDHIERILESNAFKFTPHIPVSRVMNLLHGGHVTWGIGGVPTITLPRYPIEGQWLEDPGGALTDFKSRVLVHEQQDKQISQWQIENKRLRKENERFLATFGQLSSKLGGFAKSSACPKSLSKLISNLQTSSLQGGSSRAQNTASTAEPKTEGPHSLSDLKPPIT